MRGVVAATLPEGKFQTLFDAAVRTLILHSPGTVFPGPYTYRRFWFRDAAFILHALLCLGLTERARRILDTFPGRQTGTGFFYSQAGEWDANGEALWIFARYCQLTGQPPAAAWQVAVRRGARWLQRKRLPASAGERVGGLLPAGFSAEHLGPSDYYYWDDFWAVSGLRAAADLLARYGDSRGGDTSGRAAEELLQAIDRSLALAGLLRPIRHAGLPLSKNGFGSRRLTGRRLPPAALLAP